jgi:polyprenyl-phospho-N-acetylgalactosaminyl synthase
VATDGSVQQDMFHDMKFCILIPHYNHTREFAKFLPVLLAQNLALLVVDDGSQADELERLKALLAPHSNITLVCHASNRGKGGAIKTGLLEASKQGFTHAVQIDSDGQHNLADLPLLLGKSTAFPAALICGKPFFDESAPKARLYGRRITDFWVALETLSFAIKDGLCGFRIYPLQPTLQLLHHYRFGERMDFDTEVLVKACWQNIELIFVPTKVVYLQGSVSHFRYLRDNLMLITLHTRLMLGMLVRLPILLPRLVLRRYRKVTSQAQGHS